MFRVNTQCLIVNYSNGARKAGETVGEQLMATSGLAGPYWVRARRLIFGKGCGRLGGLGRVDLLDFWGVFAYRLWQARRGGGAIEGEDPGSLCSVLSCGNHVNA